VLLKTRWFVGAKALTAETKRKKRLIFMAIRTVEIVLDVLKKFFVSLVGRWSDFVASAYCR